MSKKPKQVASLTTIPQSGCERRAEIRSRNPTTPAH